MVDWEKLILEHGELNQVIRCRTCGFTNEARDYDGANPFLWGWFHKDHINDMFLCELCWTTFCGKRLIDMASDPQKYVNGSLNALLTVLRRTSSLA